MTRNLCWSWDLQGFIDGSDLTYIMGEFQRGNFLNFLDEEFDSDFEEEEETICQEEVSRVLDHLEDLLETIESDTIHEILSNAFEKIEEYADYEDEEDDD